MKKLAISFILALTGHFIQAQNEYKTEMKNSPDSNIEIMGGFDTLQIIGHNKDEIIVISTFSGNYLNIPYTKKQVLPDRASGLKQLTFEGSDNTGLGLLVEKGVNSIAIQNINHDARYKRFQIFIPNKVKLAIANIQTDIKTNYSIENHKG